MSLSVVFPGSERPGIAEVGGKAASLIRMADAGLPVPPGVVLTTGFFAPWFDEIRASATWVKLLHAPPGGRAGICDALKDLCAGLALRTEQRETLEQVRKHVTASHSQPLLAVRSSSPDEDLENASFAGGYETRIGVRPADLEQAVRECFASSLDERVLVYKQEHGFDLESPRIAVIVQEQIASEVSGVAFSLDPVTNDYDEAVVDANWGLGESVVAGLVSPDHFVVDKLSGRVLQQRQGAKQTSIWLGEGGGTLERKAHRSGELALHEPQLRKLVDAVVRIEQLFETPVDVEWAYAGGRLHVLQARPITTYVPLAPEMQTRPGERRRLYADAALSKGMTMNRPLSRVGLDLMQGLFGGILERVLGFTDFSPVHGLVCFAGGRMYLNMSGILWLGISPEMLAKSTAITDVLLADILMAVDGKRYRAERRPRWFRLRLLGVVPRVLWFTRRVLARALWAYVAPRRAHRTFLLRVEAYERDVRENLDYDLPLEEFLTLYSEPIARRAFETSFPALAAGLISAGPLLPGKSPEVRALGEQLESGFTGNVTVEMGVALYHLARMLTPSDFEDIDQLARRVESRELPAEFLRAWDTFVARFGCRGPLEMDVASPRYGDDPRLALRQMSFMADSGADFDPEAAHQRLVDARHAACAELLKRSGWLRRGLLRRVFLLIDLFAGSRDTPKYHSVAFIHAIRKRVQIEGGRLVVEGRLDAPEHVFDLTFEEIVEAARDRALDLRALREEHTRFVDKVAAQVRDFPAMIDSRGRIQRPAPRPERPGELSGMPVSPGTVTGPVKLLHDPHEKRVEPGDVLVAYTTDPGWTPLFVNAAAVVLEVGGTLQHGAVIAREYGKPCVVGIDRVMTRLREGQQVEVDGSTGVIRTLDPAPDTLDA